MPRYHVSEDGVSRICKAATAASCTALGVDGEAAPHGEFADGREAQRFAEGVLERSTLGAGLFAGARRDPSSLSDRTDPYAEMDARRAEEAKGIASEHERNMARIGKDPVADAARFEETSQRIAAIVHAIDVLGSQDHPERRTLIEENHALGQRLGRKSYQDELDQQSSWRKPLPDLKALAREMPKTSIGLAKIYRSLDGIQRDLDEQKISNAEARRRIAAAVERIKERSEYDDSGTRAPALVYRAKLESIAEGIEPAQPPVADEHWKAVVDGMEEYKRSAKYSSKEWATLDRMAESIRGEGVLGEPHSLSHMVELARKLEKSSRRARKPELKALHEKLQTAIYEESRSYR